MRIQSSIERKLTSELSPVHLEVDNESRMHSVPPGSETHFRVLVVSDGFENTSLIDRHRRVHEILRDELAGGVHALTIRALTPSEWQERRGDEFRSPPCLGGSKDGRS